MIIMFSRSVKFPPCHLERVRFVSSPTLVKERKRQKKSALWVALSYMVTIPSFQDPQPREATSQTLVPEQLHPVDLLLKLSEDKMMDYLSYQAKAVLF